MCFMHHGGKIKYENFHLKLVKTSSCLAAAWLQTDGDDALRRFTYIYIFLHGSLSLSVGYSCRSTQAAN